MAVCLRKTVRSIVWIINTALKNKELEDPEKYSRKRSYLKFPYKANLNTCV